MISCSNSADKARIAYLEEQIEELTSANNNSSSGTETSEYAENNNEPNTESTIRNDFVGTYEFTDIEGHKFLLTLNDDETAQIKINDLVRYGSWEKYSPIDYNPLVSFVGDEKPFITFPNHESKKCQFLSIVDDHIYYEYQSVKAKNPNLRLPIKKIK